MKYTVTKLENSKVEVKVVFKKAEYDAKYEEELNKELATVEVKGFRKGHCPKSKYLSLYGDGKVQNNTMNELINESYKEIIVKEKIEIVGMANISLLDDLKDTEWGYKATVSVYPEIEAKDYFGIVCKQEEVNVTDEDVENEVKRNLAMKADLEVKENGVLEKGDTAIFDFCGYVDGKEFDGGKAENYELEIGSGRFIPGFEDQMVGMKNDEEKDINVTFPTEYAKELAGKAATFKVKLHEVKQKVLPELNDDFVSELEIKDVKTVSEWKAFLKQNLTTDRMEASKNKYEDDVMTILLKNNPVNIPQEMVDEQVEKKVNELNQTAKQYQMPVDLLLKYQGIESVDQYKELLVPGIKNNLHYEVVMAAICKQEKVKLVASDYTKYYKQMANGQDVKEVMAKYPKEAVGEYFKMLKTHDLVMESVKAE